MCDISHFLTFITFNVDRIFFLKNFSWSRFLNTIRIVFIQQRRGSQSKATEPERQKYTKRLHN